MALNTMHKIPLWVKVKLCLCLPEYHNMKTQSGVEVQLRASLTSALDGGEWSAPHPRHFSQGKEPEVPAG